MSDINFLPSRYVELAERSRRRPMNFLAIGITAIALVGVWILSDRSTALAYRPQILQAELDQRASAKAEADALRSEMSSIQAQRVIAREISQPVSAAQVLATVAQITPHAIKLTDLELVAYHPTPRKAETQPHESAHAAAEPEYEPTWLKLTLSGVAPEQADIVALTRAFSEHPLFTQVRLRSSGVVQSEYIEARAFAIDISIDLDREFVPAASQEGASHANP
ncbi:MAG: PilN domain-containing protein [Planctomycetota bacterium]